MGVLYLDDLVLADDDVKIADIMNEDFKSTNVYQDQEDVAQIFKRYDITVLPVLNNENRLVGVITVDDIIDVIEEETNEYIAIQAGMQPLED